MGAFYRRVLPLKFTNNSPRANSVRGASRKPAPPADGFPGRSSPPADWLHEPAADEIRPAVAVDLRIWIAPGEGSDDRRHVGPGNVSDRAGDAVSYAERSEARRRRVAPDREVIGDRAAFEVDPCISQQSRAVDGSSLTIVRLSAPVVVEELSSGYQRPAKIVVIRRCNSSARVYSDARRCRIVVPFVLQGTHVARRISA